MCIGRLLDTMNDKSKSLYRLCEVAVDIVVRGVKNDEDRLEDAKETEDAIVVLSFGLKVV
jgi:hypothetical protein